jgi:hypothetical protein
LILATGAAVIASVAFIGSRAATATSPTCFGDPYSYTQQQLHACGVRTFPLLSKVENADGSTTYTYNVAGDVETYRIPPPNFDFTKATQAQLDEYNIPPGTSLSNLHIVVPPPFLAESGMTGSGPGTPAVNLGRVTPTQDNGGIGTFNSTPLPGGRPPGLLPLP